MDGPQATIIFNSSTQAQYQALEAHINKVAIINETKPNHWDISSRNKKEKTRIGAQATLRPFLITLNKAGIADFDKAELLFLKDIGITTPKSINISAGSNQALDHKYLASFAIDFAKMFNGIIYLHGAILPHRSEIKKPTYLYPYCTYNEAVEYTNTIEGVNHIYNFTTTNNTKWFSQFVDATYLQNWLLQKSFRMIK